MLSWLQQNDVVIGWLVVASGAMFILTLLMVPAVIIYLPADYFSHNKKRHPVLSDRHPLIQLPLLLIKNIIGLILVLAGIMMLVLPGQGIVTLLAGLVLIDFPGKYRAERWVVERKVVLHAINWIRTRAGKEELQL